MDSEKRRLTNVGPLTSERKRAVGRGTPTSNQSRGVASCISDSSSTAALPTHNIVIKKEILPQSKTNPTAFRIKSSVPTTTKPTMASSQKANLNPKAGIKSSSASSVRSTDSGKSTSSNPPPGRNPVKPVKVPTEDQVVECDEEILDGLYTVYLQQRLLAQIAKQKKDHQEAEMDKITVPFLKHAMDRPKNEARLNSIRRIEKERAHINAMKEIEGNMDSLLKILLNPECQETVQNFEQNLTSVCDVIPVIGHQNTSTSTLPSQDKDMKQDFDFKPVEEAHEKIKKAAAVPDSSLRIAEDLHKSLETLQTIRNTSKGEVKDLNEKIIQLASLSISKSLLDSDSKDTEPTLKLQ